MPLPRTSRPPATRPENGRDASLASCELRVERLAAGGEGVGHLPDGRAIFVPLTATGDRVLVHVTEWHKRFARGEVERLLEPGASRRAARCEVFGRCGGCAWQHIHYAEQVAAKGAILREALARIGGCVVPAELPFTPSPQAYAYRGRARLLASAGRLGYRERRSHSLCAVRRCPVLADPLEQELGRLAERVARAHAAAAAKGSATEQWEICLGSGGRTRTARLDTGGPTHRRDDSGYRLTLQIGEDAIAVSAGTFVQANLLLLEALGTAVRRATAGGERLLELFAGAGFFTLGLARDFAQVVAVEANPGALSDLRNNLVAAERTTVEVVAGRVETVLQRGVAFRPDVVFLDPPRAGLGAGAANRLARLGARRIVYLSCDPATLARDVAQLLRCRYRLASVQGFDLFPQTPHVEALVVLEAS